LGFWKRKTSDEQSYGHRIRQGRKGDRGEKEIDFVFNSELKTEHGESKNFWDAIGRDGDEGEHWLQASDSECMNFMKGGSWRKKLRSEVKSEGRKIIGAKFDAKAELSVWATCKSLAWIMQSLFHQLVMTRL
jgi:hypothetical protein